MMGLRLIFALGAAVFALQPRAAQPEEVRIELRPQVAAHGSQVLLGHVAVIHTGREETIRQLVSQPLAVSPRPGSALTLRRESISRRVEMSFLNAGVRANWSGSDEVVVQAAAQEVSAVQLERVAAAYIHAWAARHLGNLRVQISAPTRDLIVPEGAIVFTARGLESVAPARRMWAWVDVSVGSGHIRSVPVTFTVEGAPDLADTSGTVTRRPSVGVPAGASRAVSRGEWVELQLRAGAIELAARAQVLQDGSMGELVQVRTSGAASPVTARVIAPGRVEAAL